MFDALHDSNSPHIFSLSLSLFFFRVLSDFGSLLEGSVTKMLLFSPIFLDSPVMFVQALEAYPTLPQSHLRRERNFPARIPNMCKIVDEKVVSKAEGEKENVVV